MMRIWGQLVNFILLPVVVLFQTYASRRPRSLQRPQFPPGSLPIRVPQPDPTDQPAPRPGRVPQPDPTDQPAPRPGRVPQTDLTHQPAPRPGRVPQPDPTDQPAPRPGRQRPHPDGYIVMRMELPLLVMGFCFTVIGVALQAFQTSKPLPITFHWVYMLLELSFVLVILSVYIQPPNQRASLVMFQAAVLLSSTAFMWTISIYFPSPFLEISVALYFLLVLPVMVSNMWTMFSNSDRTASGQTSELPSAPLQDSNLHRPPPLAPDATPLVPDATPPVPDATLPAPDATPPVPDATLPAPDATPPLKHGTTGLPVGGGTW